MAGLLHLLSPLVAFAVNVAAQVLLVRRARGGGLLKSVVAGCGIGALILLAGELALRLFSPLGGADAAPLAAANLLIYGALSYCYFHFVNLGETARRIRILREIRIAGGSLSLEELRRRYHSAEMLDRRIGRLAGTGQLVVRDGRLFVGKPLMRLFATVLVALKVMFLGKRSEFEA